MWQIVRGWQSFWYVKDGYAVYKIFIDDLNHIVINRPVGYALDGS
jgi:IS1 family transposase